MSYLDDPRVFFAAERTLLAWVRTGISMIGLGFLVARFGPAINLGIAGAPVSNHTGPVLIGVAMVILGALCCAIPAWQFRHFVATLSATERPPRWSAATPSWLAWFCAATGMALAAYLVW